MQMRKHTFEGDKVGRTDFFVVYQSVRQIDPEKITKEDRPYVAAALRTLESVSDPVGDLPADADEFTADLRFRKLKDEGGTIEISAKLHEKIAGWIDTAKFQAGLMIAVDDATDRWNAAEKFEQSDGAPRMGVVKKRK